MADYSYVSVTVPDTPEARAIVEEYGDTEPWETTNREGDAVLVVEFPEARWGFPDMIHGDAGDQEVGEMLRKLMEAGIPWDGRDDGGPWDGRDDGGFEWSETDYAWRPGMSRPRSRETSNGYPALTDHQWRAIKAEAAKVAQEGSNAWAARVVAMVEHHMEPDPRRWFTTDQDVRPDSFTGEPKPEVLARLGVSGSEDHA